MALCTIPDVKRHSTRVFCSFLILYMHRRDSKHTRHHFLCLRACARRFCTLRSICPHVLSQLPSQVCISCFRIAMIASHACIFSRRSFISCCNPQMYNVKAFPDNTRAHARARMPHFVINWSLNAYGRKCAPEVSRTHSDSNPQTVSLTCSAPRRREGQVTTCV